MGPIPPGFGADADGRLLIGGMDRRGAGRRSRRHALVRLRQRADRRAGRALPGGIPDGGRAALCRQSKPLRAIARSHGEAWSTASTSPRRASSARVARPRACRSASPGPGKRDAGARNGDPRRRHDQPRKRRRGGAGAGDLPSALGMTAEARGPGQSAVRAQGRGHEDGRAAAASSGSTMTASPALVRRLIDAGADWRGLHIFAGSQALHADGADRSCSARRSRWPRRSPRKPAHAPPEVNLGGGFGIPYFARRRSRSTSKRSEQRLAKTLGERARNPRRHPIRDRARPLAGRRGGGLSDPHRRPQGEPRPDLPRHRRRAPSHARRVRQFRPAAAPQLSGRHRQPLRRRPRRKRPSSAACARRSTCWPTRSMLPRAEVGDLVAIFCAGAYGLSASPQAFLSQPEAREMLV